MNRQKLYINDLSNYNSKLNISDVGVFIKKYYEILCEFINYMFDRKETKHITNVEYTMGRGIDMISHIFKMLTIYTKNIDLVSFHTKKAFLYYMEFMGQIGNDSNVFLKLTSKDAILFVYKKTIFEIINNYKNKETNDKEQVSILNKISTKIDIINSIYKNVFVNNFNDIVDVELNLKENENENKEYFSKLNSNNIAKQDVELNNIEIIHLNLVNKKIDSNNNNNINSSNKSEDLIKKKINIQLKRKFVSICNILNYYVDIEKKDNRISELLNYFIDKLIKKNISAKMFLQILYLFVKKYYKFMLIDTNEKRRVLNSLYLNMKKKEIIEDKYIYLSGIKYVNWLFTQ